MLPEERTAFPDLPIPRASLCARTGEGSVQALWERACRRRSRVGTGCASASSNARTPRCAKTLCCSHGRSRPACCVPQLPCNSAPRSCRCEGDCALPAAPWAPSHRRHPARSPPPPLFTPSVHSPVLRRDAPLTAGPPDSSVQLQPCRRGAAGTTHTNTQASPYCYCERKLLICWE